MLLLSQGNACGYHRYSLIPIRSDFPSPVLYILLYVHGKGRRLLRLNFKKKFHKNTFHDVSF